jgi:hypothetical protein
MTKNLETADKIAKVSLSLTCLIFYALKIIRGPFAHALMILSVAVIVLYVIKLLAAIKHS